MKTNWLSRKFIIAVGLIVISLALMIFTNKVNFVEWGNFVKWICGIYMTDNVVGKFAPNTNVK
jgi:hypothetical protein